MTKEMISNSHALAVSPAVVRIEDNRNRRVEPLVFAVFADNDAGDTAVRWLLDGRTVAARSLLRQSRSSGKGQIEEAEEKKCYRLPSDCLSTSLLFLRAFGQHWPDAVPFRGKRRQRRNGKGEIVSNC